MKNGARTLLLVLGDVIMQIVAFFIMLQISFPGDTSGSVINSHLMPFGVIFFTWIFIFFLFSLYETQSVKPTIPNLRIIGIASIVAFTASIVLFYVVSSFGITPKTNLVIFSFTFIILFLAWRRFFYSIFSMYFRKSVAFVVDLSKDGSTVNDIKDYIENYPQSGFFIMGIYSSLEEFIRNHSVARVDTLIVSKSALQGSRDIKLLYGNVENILDLTYAYENILGKIPVDAIDETWFLHNVKGTSKTFYDMISYVINVTIATLILIITSPILLIVAFLILLEGKGNIFYTQLRVGKNNKTFKLYKFRSMVVGADQGGAEWTVANDPRITNAGKIIRKLHIDEVPQLWNVIRGEMALIGPRPEIPSFAEKMEKEVKHYELRHIINPGFTGWAQIKWRNARGIAESKEKFEYDLYYIKNRNIFLDLGIFLRTVIIIFTHKS